jgi:hypothetical protein
MDIKTALGMTPGLIFFHLLVAFPTIIATFRESIHWARLLAKTVACITG